jgi:hypothetical protein
MKESDIRVKAGAVQGDGDIRMEQRIPKGEQRIQRVARRAAISPGKMERSRQMGRQTGKVVRRGPSFQTAQSGQSRLRLNAGDSGKNVVYSAPQFVPGSGIRFLQFL